MAPLAIDIIFWRVEPFLRARQISHVMAPMAVVQAVYSLGIDSCRSDEEVEGQQQADDSSHSHNEREAIWTRVWNAFCDEPKKINISYASFKTLSDYMCMIRGKQHLKKDRMRHSGESRGIGKTRQGHKERPRRQGDPCVSRTIFRQRESTRSDGAASRNPRRQGLAIRDPLQPELKENVAECCGGRHGQSSVGEVVVEKKKDLESCHVDRSAGGAAVKLLTRKKLSKNGVYLFFHSSFAAVHARRTASTVTGRGHDG
ncbi:hypothetical protein DFH09DRAFT_1088818 [Mycena vulgaris]|nr:hypothetical protein DFH09DRAFT_1088818 [Mycena vulgaris]